MAKLIDIPEPFHPDPVNEPEKLFTFEDFLNGALSKYKPFTTFEKMDRAALVRKTLREMNGTLKLEDADYDDVLAACKTAAFNPSLAEELMPFKKAILNPQEVETPTKT